MILFDRRDPTFKVQSIDRKRMGLSEIDESLELHSVNALCCQPFESGKEWAWFAVVDVDRVRRTLVWYA